MPKRLPIISKLQRLSFAAKPPTAKSQACHQNIALFTRTFRNIDRSKAIAKQAQTHHFGRKESKIDEVGESQQFEVGKVDNDVDDDVWRSKSTRLTRQRRRAVSLPWNLLGPVFTAWSVLVHALRCVWLERNEQTDATRCERLTVLFRWTP